MTLTGRIRQGIGYAFGDLLGDIGKWLLLGILLAGLFSFLLPADFFLRYLSNEWASLLLMLLVGIPLYICASASTPIAAALILKGLSPGAALVLLLAGPATNAATLTVVSRQLGRGATGIYLFAIAISSVLLGWLTNRLYAWFDLDLVPSAATVGHDSHGIFSVAAAVLLLLLLVKEWWQSFRQRRPDCCNTS